jgi:hypothetical protein
VWYTISLTTVDTLAVEGRFEGNVLFTNVPISNLDTGFATIGTNSWSGS